jgi:tRNA-specific 2-thiouridylase
LGVGKKRVLVAMSGGVDSAVAAARLLDQGFDVVGVTLHLWDYPEDADAKAHGRCCAPEDQYDARRVADFLGFPHFTFDRRELFEREVVKPFVESYGSGTTPSPCSACNRTVKLRELGVLADRLNAEYVATGHYARTGIDAAGSTFLRTGLDPNKDQSYFLYATAPELLARMLFPLGESHKPEVRAEALARKLPGAAKGESQELCFVGAGAHAYASFVEDRLETRKAGPVLDRDGTIVGQHDGIHRFTVGQRKGLKIALGRPVFVTSIDPVSGAVSVGDDGDLLAESAALEDVVLAPGIALPLEAHVRIRYRHGGVRAKVQSAGDHRNAVVTFLEPVRAVAAGQIAVFYQGDRVLGGGRIDASRRSRAA